MEQARRILELMFLTAWADGRFEGSEALAIHKLAGQHAQLREVGPTGDIESIARRRLAQKGLDASVHEAAAQITERSQREIAFQCCAKVSGADGLLAPQESQVLRLLQSDWNLSPADVERLLVLATR